MNPSKKIYLFSDKIGVGKTTTLLNWAKTQRDIGGFLSPKIAGKRYFLDLDSLQIRPMENTEGSLKIGQFTFDENVFKWARFEIMRQFNTQKRGIIIDEIGPLEIKNEEGFHPILLQILEENTPEKPDLIIVVRDFMVEQFIEKYKIHDIKIVPKSFFNNQNISLLNGLVLCGGESNRMQSDKALLKYSNQEQWKKMKQTLQLFCDDVWVSINANQAENWAQKEDAQFIVDDKNFENLGPLNGILLATKRNPELSLMISAIDYPLLNTEHFIHLNNKRATEFEGVFFQKNENTEPLIGVLEHAAFPKLWSFVEHGGKSFKQFLAQINIKKITPENTDFLNNINTLEEFNNFNKSE